MRILLLFSLFLFGSPGFAQKTSYRDSLENFIQTYISGHEVVLGEDRHHLHFFPADEKYRLVCQFEPTPDAHWFPMPTSGKIKKMHRSYGILHFSLEGKAAELTMYQSQNLLQSAEYSDYLFVPFTDLTNGSETYEGGRYLDFKIGDIQNNRVVLDFNKAYNPYCAYTEGYNCPIPPKANNLALEIRAGEKKFGIRKH